MKILIVEDTHSDAFLISASLKILKIPELEFRIVTTYEEGMKEAKSLYYDLCVFDYNLPGGSGCGLLSALRALGVDIPTVIFSGFDDPRLTQESMDAGALAYMSKDTAIFDDWGRKLLLTAGRADLLKR